MSIRVMTWAWDHAKASGNELLLLLAIADHASDDGSNAWPSQATLARRTRLSQRTVRRLTDRLVAAGVLAVEHRTGTSSRYRVLIHNPGQIVRPVNLTPRTQPCPPTPDIAVSAEPSFNRPTIPPTPTADAAGEPCRKHAKTGKPGLNCRHCGTTARIMAEAAEAEARRLPERCGQCDQHRMVELPDGRVGRCPRCHPLAVAS